MGQDDHKRNFTTYDHPLRVAIGEKKVEPEKRLFYNTHFGKGIVWTIPWPKGAPTSKSFIPGTGLTNATDFELDREILLKTIERFILHGQTNEFQPNPVFGTLSQRSWGRMMWRHIDHHLCQFSA